MVTGCQIKRSISTDLRNIGMAGKWRFVEEKAYADQQTQALPGLLMLQTRQALNVLVRGCNIITGGQVVA